MKKLFTVMAIVAFLVVGCGINEDDFVKDSNDIYVQMFKDGVQTEDVDELYHEYTKKYSNFENDDLYKAIDGMYHGLGTGEATRYQLKAMHILNER